MFLVEGTRETTLGTPPTIAHDKVASCSPSGIAHEFFVLSAAGHQPTEPEVGGYREEDNFSLQTNRVRLLAVCRYGRHFFLCKGPLKVMVLWFSLATAKDGPSQSDGFACVAFKPAKMGYPRKLTPMSLTAGNCGEQSVYSGTCSLKSSGAAEQHTD